MKARTPVAMTVALLACVGAGTPAHAATNTVIFDQGGQKRIALPSEGVFTFTLVGADGGSLGGFTGGDAAKITATVDTATFTGDTFFGYVGASPFPGAIGAGSGGGAATDLRLCSLECPSETENRIIVAAGGGGSGTQAGGGNAGTSASGANGGSDAGTGGGGASEAGVFGFGGTGDPSPSADGDNGDASTAGGAGGDGGDSTIAGGTPGNAGGAGLPGVVEGGAAGTGAKGGGGGGGGFGGGGGGGGTDNSAADQGSGGGGGGSSHVRNLTAGLAQVGGGTLAETSDPSITVTWDDTAKPAFTGGNVTKPVAGLKQRSATIDLEGQADTALGNDADPEDGSGPPVQYQVTPAGAAPASAAWQNIATDAQGLFDTTVPTGGPGVFDVHFRQVDLVGNASDPVTRTVTVDSVRPALTISSPAAGGYITTRAVPLDGTAGIENSPTADQDLVTVEIHDGPDATGPVVTSRNIDPQGNGAFPANAKSAELPKDGTYTAVFQQKDGVDDEGTTRTVTFEVDSSAPQVTLTAPKTGTVGGFTNLKRPEIAGTRSTGPQDALPTAEFEQNGTPITGVVTPGAGDGFTVKPNENLADGQVKLTVEQLDAASRKDEEVLFFTVDATKPNISASIPKTNGFVTSERPIITVTRTGTSPDDLTPVVVILDKNGDTFDTPTVAPTGTTTYAATPTKDLPDDNYSFVVSQSDKAGNSTTLGAAAFVVDATKPTVSLDALPPFVTTTKPEITGTASNGTDDLGISVLYYRNATGAGTPDHTVALAKGLTFTVPLASRPALSQGQWSVRVQQKDSANNTTTTPAEAFIVDSLKPAVTLTGGPSGPTNLSPIEFSGKGGTIDGDSDDADEVTIQASEASDFSTDVTSKKDPDIDDDGHYSVSFAASELQDGKTYFVRALQEDEAGNQGVSAPVRQVIVDRTAPNVALTGPDDDTFFNVVKPEFTGTRGVVTGDSSSVALEIFDGHITPGANQAPDHEIVQSFGTGAVTVKNYGHSFDATDPQGDEYTVRLRQTDHATNSSVSEIRRITVDTTKPAMTLTPFTVSNQPRPAFSGKGEPGISAVTLEITNTGDGTKTVVGDLADADGNYSILPPDPLEDGVYKAATKQTDRANNTGTATEFTFEIDKVGPTVIVNQPAADAITGDNTPEVRGIAQPGRDVEVEFFPGKTQSDPAVRSLVVPADGAGAFTATPAQALGDGEYTVVASQQDAAGNSGASSARTFLVDTGPPVVTMGLDLKRGATADTTPAIGGTATEKDREVLVTISAGPSVSSEPIRTLRATSGADGAWTLNVAPALGDGQYTAEAKQVDAAGNTGMTDSITFVVDASAPSVAIGTPADGQALVQNQPIISGTAGRAARDLDTVTVFLEGPAPQTVAVPRDRDGSFRYQPPAPLPDGQYRVVVGHEVELGNGARSTPVDFIVDTQPPNTLLSTGPLPVGVGTRTVAVEFGASEGATRYRCEFDGEPVRFPCAPPTLLLENLRAGNHFLRIFAIDVAGNEDPTPSELVFTVDVNPPNMRVGRRIAARRNRTVGVTLDCPRSQSLGPCAGAVVLRVGKKAITRAPIRFRIALGRRATPEGKIKRNAMRRLNRARRKGIPIRVTLNAADGRGNVGRKTVKRRLIRAGLVGR